jgi:hypothetical protein
MAPSLPICRPVQELGDSDGAFGNTDNVELGLLVAEFLDDIVEDILHMIPRISISRDRVLLAVKAVGTFDGAGSRQGKPRGLRYGFLSPTPPAELSHVGQDNSWRIIFTIISILSLGLDILHHVHRTPFVNPALSANDTVCEDSKILCVLVEEDHNSLLLCQIRRNEDW